MSRVTAAAAPVTAFLTTIGFKVGGFQLTNGVIIALVALIVAGLVIGAFIYERSKQRAHEKTLFIARNRADATSYNVEIE